MAKGLSDYDIRKIAKKYCAAFLYNLLGTGASSELITDEEQERFVKAIEKIANKIGPDEGYGELDQIINDVIKIKAIPKTNK